MNDHVSSPFVISTTGAAVVAVTCVFSVYLYVIISYRLHFRMEINKFYYQSPAAVMIGQPTSSGKTHHV